MATKTLGKIGQKQKKCIQIPGQNHIYVKKKLEFLYLYKAQ